MYVFICLDGSLNKLLVPICIALFNIKNYKFTCLREPVTHSSR